MLMMLLLIGSTVPRLPLTGVVFTPLTGPNVDVLGEFVYELGRSGATFKDGGEELSVTWDTEYQEGIGRISFRVETEKEIIEIIISSEHASKERAKEPLATKHFARIAAKQFTEYLKSKRGRHTVSPIREAVFHTLLFPKRHEKHPEHKKLCKNVSGRIKHHDGERSSGTEKKMEENGER